MKHLSSSSASSLVDVQLAIHSHAGFDLNQSTYGLTCMHVAIP